MRVTIIPADGFVSVDGKGRNQLDLKFIDLSVHAIQWYGADGEIERRDERGRIVANEDFSDLTPYQLALDKWQAATEIAEAAQAANDTAKTLLL